MNPFPQTSTAKWRLVLDVTGYDQLANKKQLIGHFKSWSEPVLRLLDTAPDDGVMLWDLLDMELLPNLIKGKALLIGDAAHPFLPRKLSSCISVFLLTAVSRLSQYTKTNHTGHNRHGPGRCPGHRGRVCPRRDNAPRHRPREGGVAASALAAVQEGQGGQDRAAHEAQGAQGGREPGTAPDK